MMVYFCNALISSNVRLIGSDSLAFLGGDFCFGNGDLALGFAFGFDGDLALVGDFCFGNGDLALALALALGFGFGFDGDLAFVGDLCRDGELG
jgi:hypothetical protein